MQDKYDGMTAAELEKASESGDTEAMYRYWLMFADGEAGEPYFTALGWLEKAVAAGHQGAIDAYDAYRADNGDNENQAMV